MSLIVILYSKLVDQIFSGKFQNYLKNTYVHYVLCIFDVGSIDSRKLIRIGIKKQKVSF